VHVAIPPSFQCLIMSPILHEAHARDIFSADYFPRQFDTLDDNKDQDATPKPFQDSWRLTPSLMDPNSYAFSHFANQPPGYYTPTPGGFNTLYHPQAGDLHTPGMGMNTPLSMPHSVHSLQAPDSNVHLQHFNPQMLHHAHTFHDPFGHHHQQQQQQQSYAPQQFLQHQDSGYVAMDDSPHKVTPNQPDMMAPPSGRQQQAHLAMPGSLTLPGMPSGEKY
jgi:hypothetical protein